MSLASLDSTTPQELAQVFLEEVGRAALSFTSQRAEFLETLNRATSDGLLDDAFRQSALGAGQLVITEARATFWLEPVEVTWWQRWLSVFGVKPTLRWRLAKPNSGVQYEVIVAPSPLVPELSAQVSRS